MAQAKKKKRFFDVEMPIINKQTQILAFDLSELEGRFIKYDLTRILRGKSILMQFKVSVKDNKAIAVPRGILLMPYFLRRMIRKGTDYIEDSFLAECKDATLKIKPFLITRRKVSKRVRRGLREKTKEEIKKYLKEKSSEKVFEEILKNKMQKELSLILKKIYPLSLCEIKSMEIEKDLEVKEAKETPKKSEEKTKKEEEKETKEEIKEISEKPEKKEKKSKKKEEKKETEEEIIKKEK
jgi:ribosomal protein S3AE